MPNSAAVAFNSPDCPPGWKAFRQVAGRTIIGAGEPLPTGPDAKLGYDAYGNALHNVGYPHGGELLIATLQGASPQPTDQNKANVLPWYRLQYCTNSND